MKKAQEEIVGLVIIMLVVAVVFLILLGLSIRNNTNTEIAESEEISQFLDSALEYTTTCSLNTGYSYLSVNELIQACNDVRICSDAIGTTKDPCDVLAETMENLIESAWVFDPPNTPNSGYELKIEYIDTASSNEPSSLLNRSIIRACAAESHGRRGATKPIFSTSGRISLSLELC